MSDKDFPIPEKLYVSVLCFLTFNFCAMMGSLVTSFVQWVSLYIHLITLNKCVYTE